MASDSDGRRLQLPVRRLRYGQLCCFAGCISLLPRPRIRGARDNACSITTTMTGGTEAQIMMETVTAQGFPILEAFKGVFIGPTINEIAAAVAGGTVGVMGTILALETGRQRAVERKQCPYCHGSGKLACGNCYAIGAMPSATSAGGQHTCPHCSGGFLQCNHCDGEGRLIPIEYERAIRAQYEDYVYARPVDDYYAEDGPPYL